MPKYSTEFSPADDRYIRENYIELSTSEMAKVLGKTASKLKYRIRCLGLSYTPEQVKAKKEYGVRKSHKTRETRQLWSEKELNTLKKIFSEYSNAKLSKIIGRSQWGIAQKAVELGLLKSEQHRYKMLKFTTNHVNTISSKKAIERVITNRFILVNVLKEEATFFNRVMYSAAIEKARERLINRRKNAV